uniref:ribonuclease HII n=1 Tax=Vaginimicrobium propionicum TaxID=1871034 RepID=UPI0009704928|nr:ribonuclease HII [Vaginimicrobium propionicum]
MIYPYEEALAKAGFDRIAGADEAGRGACAGPLVAAAVILSTDSKRHIDGLKDSKLLTAAQRNRLYDQILANAQAVASVEISPAQCDALGMQEADLQGLRRALLRLDPQPNFALTDGFFVPGLPMESLALWKGDQIAQCVAAASIVAKVRRDRLMIELDAKYPGYGFGVHKGYVTKLHTQRLTEMGPCEIHRFSYANVQRAVKRH